MVSGCRGQFGQTAVSHAGLAKEIDSGFVQNPKPVNGGLNCTGQSEDHQACDYIGCPGKIFLNLNENTLLNPIYALA